MGFWERATTGQLDLELFETVLTVHASDIGDTSIFGLPQLGLDAGELVELGELLAVMPQTVTDRPGWVHTVRHVLRGATFFEPLDSVAKVKAALGVAP